MPWDLGEPSRPVRHMVRRYFPPGGKVIIPGCGRGHEALYLAGRGYEVTAVDLVPEPLDYLRGEARKGAVKIEAIEGDAFELPESYNGAFDVFLEQTFFSAIEPSLYPDYEQLAYRVLKPGGQLLGVFMEVPWEGGPPYNSPPELVLRQFPDERWLKGRPKRVRPQNPARPGPEYTLRLVKRA